MYCNEASAIMTMKIPINRFLKRYIRIASVLAQGGKYESSEILISRVLVISLWSIDYFNYEI